MNKYDVTTPCQDVNGFYRSLPSGLARINNGTDQIRMVLDVVQADAVQGHPCQLRASVDGATPLPLIDNLCAP